MTFSKSGPRLKHALLLSLSLQIFLVTQPVRGIYRDKLGDWHFQDDDDTVIIDALPSVDEVAENFHDHQNTDDESIGRQKRQIFASPFLFRTMASGLNEGDTCVTPKGEAGQCARLKHCYPVMYGFDLNDDAVYEGNLELARMLTESSGSCGGGGPATYQLHYGSSSVGHGLTVPPQGDLVCCTGNLTKLDVPKFPMTLTVGGQPAAANSYPSMVALLSGRLFCGGSLIDSRNVLTAAHCVAHMDGTAVSKVTAHLGDHDIYSNRDGLHETRKIRRIIKHRHFNPRTLHNDVAILTLSSPVSFTSKISPASLGAGGGTSGTVAGWGKLGEHSQFPSVLHHVTIGLLTNQKCRQIYGSLAPGGIIESMMCGGSSTRDACMGDSGGPLFSGGAQVGIVSWGIGCGRYPGVYSRISSFLPWIQKNQRIP